jgi:hypothetical protein
MRRTFLLCGVLLVSRAASAQAEPVHGAREEARDRREMSQDRREAREDYFDLKSLEALRAEFEAARARRDMRALEGIDRRIREQASRELADDAGDLRRAERELHRDRRELRADERRTVRDAVETRPGERRDQAELRRDRRELRDDARDAAARRADLQRHRELLGEIHRLGGRLDPAALDRKHAILGELIEIARFELRQDARELREDRRELREDHR